ncbi:hypothetical protein, partial [Kocuria marina]|uniref:hypothetical protein n=1 Tax=Kocuria marina TaxID=223184 RepID=UPI0015CF7889
RCEVAQQLEDLGPVRDHAQRHVQAAARNQSRSSGPQRSSAVPDAAELDTTTTTALRPSR